MCRASGARASQTSTHGGAVGYLLEAPSGAVLGARPHPRSPKVSDPCNHRHVEEVVFLYKPVSKHAPNAFAATAESYVARLKHPLNQVPRHRF